MHPFLRVFKFWCVQFSCSVMSDSLRPHGLQHARVLCPSPTPGAYSTHVHGIYLSFSPLPFASLLFSAISKNSSDNYFACLYYFFLRMTLNTASCAISCTSIHSSSGTLSDLIPWIYFSLPLIIIWIWFRSYLNGLEVFPTFFNLSLNLAIRCSWSEPQSAPGLVFADCIELLHLQLQRI